MAGAGFERVDGSMGRDKLCALYHSLVPPAAESALNRNLLKMQEFVRQLYTLFWPVKDRRPFRNFNTLERLAADLP